ncbi:MAG: hypothetical protein ACO1SX_12870 [Actinomycetota bacterium]
MSTETGAIELPQCTRCGTRYRPSHFQRRCNCPACGRSLDAAERRTPLRLSPVATYGAIAVCLGVGVTALAARNFTNRKVSAASSSVREDRPLAASDLPADFALNVEDKIRFLKRELARAPRDPVLWSALGDAYTYRAVLARDAQAGRDQVQESLAHVRECISKLGSPAPLAAEQLRRRLDAFDHLVFTDRPAGSAAARAWRLRVGREIFPRESVVSTPGSVSVSVPVGAGHPLGAASPGNAAPGGPPPGAVGPVMGGYPSGAGPTPMLPARPFPETIPGQSLGVNLQPTRERPQPAYSLEGSEPRQRMATASGVASRILPQGGSPRSSGTLVIGSPPGGMPPTANQLESLRAQFRKNPGDPIVADGLGGLLSSLGSRYVPSRTADDQQIASKRSLQEAARVYRTAAGKVKQAVERAAFLDAAADIHRQLEEWEAQYRVLVEATRSLPFSDTLWRKLEKAALRQGEMSVCQSARQNADKWAFPAIDVAMIPAPDSP